VAAAFLPLRYYVATLPFFGSPVFDGAVMTEGQSSYWDRVHLPIGHGPVDFLISLPLIIPPLTLLIAFQFYVPLSGKPLLPRWKELVGAYLLYCAFAFWHFHAPWLLVLVAAVLGAILCAAVVIEIALGRRALAQTLSRLGQGRGPPA
jgi:hypothetical protein